MEARRSRIFVSEVSARSYLDIRRRTVGVGGGTSGGGLGRWKPGVPLALTSRPARAHQAQAVAIFVSDQCSGADEPTVTVDNIEVAQFVYLLLHNEKIRDVIDTIGKKGVLLLGRFTEGRMVVLERLRDKLRDLGFLPMVFNFDKPETKNFTETVRLLCNLSHFVIVDITNPRSAPLELQATVPDYMVPFAPILQQGEEPFAMFVDLQNQYDWVLQPVIGYHSVDNSLRGLLRNACRA